ncbi:MAG TPA: S9 family peptidase [Acidimicrobiales bacterium]|nr:S9 family peptidase [Acidimicrobiales bacterium]
MPTPPAAPQRPHTLTSHGHDRSDPWYWLRDRENPAVLAYLEAENAYTDEVVRPLEALRSELFEEMKARILETDMSVPSRRGPWWYYTRSEEGKSYGIHCRRPAGGADELPPAGEPGAEEQVLLDENALAAGHDYFRIGSAAVSPDHSSLAYSTDTVGDERYALRFRSLTVEASTEAALEVVTETGYGVAWSSDSAVVFYVRFDEALRPHQLWRHRLGTDPVTDTLVYEESDRRFSLGTGRTRDGAFVVVSLHSTNTTEWLAIPADDPEATPRVILPRREGVEFAVDHLPGRPWFVILTNEDALDFKVLGIPDDLSAAPTEVIAHRPGVRIEDVQAFTDTLVLSERANAETSVRIVPLGQSARGALPSGDLITQSWAIPSAESPSSTWLGANLEPELTSIRFGRTSMVTPTSVLQVSMATRDETLLKQEPVLGGFDPARYTTFRTWATADDGTRVPVSVVHAKETGFPAPCLLYGYGAYELSTDPGFSHHRLSLLDRGLVFAIAHVRGGGEMGRAWYEDGRMEHKMHTFTDFIACARHLVEEGVAHRDAMAGRGASAGGLLIGAVANMAPDFFRALVAQVPFVDCVTTMLDDELPLTVGEWEEWGNPLADQEAYNRMLSYSPYDNVREQTYPDLLVTSGLNDPRVSYWEPAKWVAKIRALSPTTKVLLKTELGAGHGGPSGRYDAWKEEALVFAFLLNSLGMVEI